MTMKHPRNDDKAYYGVNVMNIFRGEKERQGPTFNFSFSLTLREILTILAICGILLWGGIATFIFLLN